MDPNSPLRWLLYVACTFLAVVVVLFVSDQARDQLCSWNVKAACQRHAALPPANDHWSAGAGGGNAIQNVDRDVRVVQVLGEKDGKWHFRGDDGQYYHMPDNRRGQCDLIRRFANGEMRWKRAPCA